MALSNVGIKFTVVGEGMQNIAAMNREMTSFHRTLRDIGSITLAGVALREIWQIGKQIASAAAEAQQHEMMFARVMRDNLPEAEKAARDLSVRFGDSAESMKDMLSQGRAVAGNLGLDSKAAFETARALTEVSNKFARFTGMNPAEAFHLFSQGITSGGKGLKQWGIDLDETNTKQWAVNQGWIDSTDVLNDVGKAMVRLAIEQQKVNTLAGDAKDIVPTLGGEWRKFAGDVKDTVNPFLLGAADALTHVALAANNARRELGQAIRDTETKVMPAEPSGIPGRDTGQASDWMAHYEARANRPLPQYDFSGMAVATEQMQALSVAEQNVIDRTVKVNAHLQTIQPPEGFKQVGIDTEATEKARVEEDAKVAAAASRRLRAQESMLRDMNRNDEQYWYIKGQLLDEDYKHYQDILGGETDLLRQWREYEKETIGIGRAKAGGDFFAGFASGLKELQRDLPKLGQIGNTIFREWNDEMVDWLDNVEKGSAALDDLGLAMLRTIRHQFSEQISAQYIMPAINTLFQSIGGPSGQPAPSGQIPQGYQVGYKQVHSGGLIDTVPLRGYAPALLWSGAPRLHTGLASDEFPAILQRGETVIPKTGARAQSPQIEFHIHEASGATVDQEQTTIRMDGNRAIVNLVLAQIHNGGQLGRTLDRRYPRRH